MEWFGADEAWERPTPPVGHSDVRLGVVLLAISALLLELSRSFGDFSQAAAPWQQYLSLASICAALVWRRRFPLPVFGLAVAHFFVVCTWVGEVGYTMPYQLIFFFAIYSTVAWARDRRTTVIALATLAVGFGLWVAWDFAMGQSVESFRRNTSDYTPHGLFPMIPAWVVYTAVINVCYIGGAMAMGQAAWRQARDRARLAEQAETIAGQSAELRDQAVVDERLRIARELHDVVAHHVSVMGIQAAGARRLLVHKPEQAATALEQVEQSSRQAVTQMRSLLGALRGTDETEETGREPQPTLSALPGLFEDCRRSGLQVEHDLVEDLPGTGEALPLPVQLSLFRTVQESLTNVQRHSTASRASVTVRVHNHGGDGWAEAEVLDEGRPRSGTSGSGLGLFGMRERITSHGGVLEVGPRVTGGYRVRVRLPLDGATITRGESR